MDDSDSGESAFAGPQAGARGTDIYPVIEEGGDRHPTIASRRDRRGENENDMS